MHTMINAMEEVSCLVKFSSVVPHDHTLLKLQKSTRAAGR